MESDYTPQVMESDYTPQVGDRVRSRLWTRGQWVDVKAVTEGMVCGPDEEQEWQWITIELQRPWEKVETREKVETPAPLPERWIAVRARDGMAGYASPSRIQAINPGTVYGYVVHVWSDEFGDHAEVERL